MKSNSLKKVFATDKVKTDQGIWVDFDDGISIRIRRISSKPVQDKNEELNAPYSNNVRRGKLPDSVAEDNLIKLIAGGIISDWKGILDDKGKEIPYSPENAYEIIKDEDLADFRLEVLNISQDRALYKKKADEEALGNS